MKREVSDSDFSDAYIGAGHLGIGGGYAYNYVAGPHWLWHISAIPSLIVWSQDKITLNKIKELRVKSSCLRQLRVKN